MSISRRPEEKYTDPALRERLKEEVTAGDRGGRPGQWSARKAQLLAHEYEAHGGGYTGGKDADQQHLSQWTDEDWQTSDGSSRARSGSERGDGGASGRYLPARAWEEMTPQQRREADRTKAEGSRAGQQHVANPSAARAAGRAARDHAQEPFEGYDDLTAAQVADRLGDLDDAALEQLVQHERAGRTRKTVLEPAEREQHRRGRRRAEQG
ncbi:hypothetical protein [Quadrisphaera sp. KR29]|uniref:hypothetical protein n=1 Tax=Quadrisphaera sp. KR29 TaxID=3461391 RepID=UPI0040439E15